MKNQYRLPDQILEAEGLIRDPSTPSGYRPKQAEWCCPCCGDSQYFDKLPETVHCDNPECGWPGNIS